MLFFFYYYYYFIFTTAILHLQPTSAIKLRILKTEPLATMKLLNQMKYFVSLSVHEQLDMINRHHEKHLSQLMRLWYLSYRRPAKAQASLCIRAVSPEPSLFAHLKYGSRRRVRPNIRDLDPLVGCACAFKE